MQYMLFINLGPKARDWQSLPEDDQKAIAAGYQELNQTEGVTPGTGLQPPQQAVTVRVEDGRTVTSDGPLPDVAIATDGYCLVEADDLDRVIEIAARIPAARMGGAVEIRPSQSW